MVAAASTQQPIRGPLLHCLRVAVAANEEELCGARCYAARRKTGCKLKQLLCATTSIKQLAWSRQCAILRMRPRAVLDS